MSEDGTATDLSAALNSDFFYNEIMYYVDCLQNGRRVEHCPPEESIKAIRLVMAEMASADRGGEQDWPLLLRSAAITGGTRTASVAFGKRGDYDPFERTRTSLQRLKQCLAQEGLS